jgi:adenosylhomocysteine nucleosidase
LAETGTPLVVAAMQSELRHAIEASENVAIRGFGPWVLHDVTLDGAPVRLLLSGIGMVNAAASLARALFDELPPFVLNYGCAGAHRFDIHPGDVVVGSCYVHHRSVTILPDGVERYTGMFVSATEITSVVNQIDASSVLLSVAERLVDSWRPEPWPGSDNRAPQVHVGPVGSADAWAQSMSMIERIHADHGTLCEDMEAAALAQVAVMHDVPFLAIKDVSNNELHKATEHGEIGPTLVDVELDVGRRAFALARQVLIEMRARDVKSENMF